MRSMEYVILLKVFLVEIVILYDLHKKIRNESNN